MKKVFVVGFAFGVSIAPAKAADMPVKAPPPVRSSSWTGCYLGGSVGGIWRASNSINIAVADGGAGASAAAAAGAIPTGYGDGGSSWIAGGQLGCNYRSSSWVFGFETDMSGARLDFGQTTTTNVPSFFPVATSVSHNMGSLGTTRGRLGIAWGDILVFATGGAAYALVNYAYYQSNVAGGGPVATATADSNIQVGWTAGGGLEVGFGAWSVKGEYLYYDLGNHTLDALCTGPGGARCVGAAPTVFSAHFGDTGSIVRLGLNYHLN